MRSILTVLIAAATTCLVALVIDAPAIAGAVVRAAPAPLLGAGIPALASFATGYWAIRKRRRGK